MLDLDFVRAQFPALSAGYVFLDNAGGSQTLGRVADRIRDYLLTSNVQLGASYAISEISTARVDEAARETARYMGAAEGEIVLGASTTQLLQNLSRAMEAELSPGDEIVTTEADHEANVGPWTRLASRGVVIKVWPLDPETLRLEERGLAPLLTKRTRLVAFPHVSNVLGSIHDVSALTRLAHAHGAKVCVDGVAFAPHREVDVAAWDVDYYVFSFYKVYGPHMAVLFGKRALLERLAGINHGFIDEVPYKLQPGNVNYELSHGLGGIYEYVGALGGKREAFARIAEHEERLSARLLGWLAGVRGARVWGDTVADRARRVPTIGFTVDGASPEAIVRRVDPCGVGIRHGDFYAKRLVDALGLAPAGVVRVSAVHYNTEAELDRAMSALDAAIAVEAR